MHLQSPTTINEKKITLQFCCWHNSVVVRARRRSKLPVDRLNALECLVYAIFTPSTKKMFIGTIFNTIMNTYE